MRPRFSRLHSGWSVKTANLNKWNQPEPMSNDEHEKIRLVMEKAEAEERKEQQRLGRLVERLEKMKRCRNGSGDTDCVLCGEVFRLYSRSQRRCHDCNKMTCGKCGHEVNPNRHHQDKDKTTSSASTSVSSTTDLAASISSFLGSWGRTPAQAHPEYIWLCKICAEEREVWKKSGAWLFKVSL